MLRKRRANQQSFIDQFLPEIDEDSLECRVASIVRSVLSTEDFKSAYNESMGRPALCPVMMTVATLLQFMMGYSDREAEDASAYHLRWKKALGLPLHSPGIDATSLCRFRTRLIMNDLDHEIFVRSVDACKQAGVLKNTKLQGIDSSLVIGKAATQDTFTLIRRAVRASLTQLKKHGVEIESILRRDDYEKDGKPKIDWDSRQAKQELIGDLVHDATIVLEAMKQCDGLEEEAEFLAKIAGQDIEYDEDGKIAIKQGVAKDRIISTVDPEMRHGHKSSKGKVDGYKVHVVVEPDSEIITHVSCGEANGADSAAVPEAIEGLEEIDAKPDALWADMAYTSPDVCTEALREGVAIVGKCPKSPSRKGCFSKDEFDIDLENNTVTCPGGIQVSDPKEAKDRKGRPRRKFHFPPEVCSVCPLESQCRVKKTKKKHNQKKTGRIVTLHYQEAMLQSQKEYQKTEEFTTVYNSVRPAAERGISQVKRNGGGEARYIGVRKLTLQERFAATVSNLKKLSRYATTEAIKKLSRPHKGLVCPIPAQ